MPLSVALGGVFVVATLGLAVFLGVWPALATYAPAIFPALALVGLGVAAANKHPPSVPQPRG